MAAAIAITFPALVFLPNKLEALFKVLATSSNASIIAFFSSSANFLRASAFAFLKAVLSSSLSKTIEDSKFSLSIIFASLSL